MKKQILLFGFSDQNGIHLKKELKEKLAVQKIRIQLIVPSDYGKPVGELAGITPLQNHFQGLTGFSGMGSPLFPMPRDEKSGNLNSLKPVSVSKLPARILLLCGLDDADIDAVLKAFNESGITKDDLKAILTPANSSWTIYELSDALEKEHAQMN